MSEPNLFTCLSCSIAFFSAEEQRVHYRSDHHRYNMKRRISSLPPVSVAIFNQKVLDRKSENAVRLPSKGTSCEMCNKIYTTENAYRSHLQSRKHKENESKPMANAQQPPPTSVDHQKVWSPVHENTEEDDEDERTLEEKIAAARSRLTEKHCLFCPQELQSLEGNLTHMSLAHSFFVPDAEYLIDIQGLILYLGEKIVLENTCIYCNGKGKEFRTLEAVRKHMVDKSHCKIAYDTERDRLEVSDYYDFTSSYAEATPFTTPHKSEEDEAWEDVESDDDRDVDEVVEAESDSPTDDDSGSNQSLPDSQITYGDSHYELVLPSGARIGHRNLRKYYAQSFLGTSREGKIEDPKSGAALVRKLLADKNSALVPRKGGYGAFGSGTDVVKARNRGEAREAGRHVREFRDQKRREEFKTRVAFINNHQKHYRDPLLQ